MEGGHVEFVDVVNGVLHARLSDKAYRFAVGIAGIASGIADECAHTLGRLHLIVHGALHLTRDAHKAVIGAYDDDIVVVEVDVAAKFAIEDVVVNVYGGH